MSRLQVRVVAGLVLMAALALTAVLLPGHIPAAGAATPVPAAPATPAAGVTTPVPAASATPAGGAGPAAAAGSGLPGDPANDRTSVSIGLQEGFIMDPFLVPVVGSGQRAAAELVPGCNGVVGAQPNVVVNWSGKADQLSFFVYSDADPVLVVQSPDGAYVCNDDAGLSTTQPLVKIKNPAPGAYKFYVGSADKANPALGFFGVSKLDLTDTQLAELDLSPMLHHRDRPRPQAPPRLNVDELLAERTAVFGTADLTPGFKPVQVFAAGGGDLAAFSIVDDKLACAGFLSPIPSYSFTWKGKGPGLRLFFESLKDSSLAVVTPAKEVLCGMNTSAGNLNPTVDVTEPVDGTYEVYVASMAPSTVVAGRLTITGNLKAAPAVLAPAGQ